MHTKNTILNEKVGKIMKHSNRSLIIGEIVLIFVAILWGSCFIFQKKGMDYIEPFTLGAFRFTLGGLVLVPIIKLTEGRNKNSSVAVPNTSNSRKVLWTGGILCGVALFLGGTFQQISLVYTTAGKAAFLTSMELVVVEILSVIIIRKLQWRSIFGVLFAIAGMYLLCMKDFSSVNFGDIVALIGAFFWGIQIIFIDKYAKLVNILKLSVIQFFIAGGLSVIGMLFFEKPEISSIVLATVPILYTAIIEVAVCHTLQIVGQKYVPPVLAAVTLSMESVFAVIFGVIILKEILSGREIWGMILMILAVVIIQLPNRRRTSADCT